MNARDELRKLHFDGITAVNGPDTLVRLSDLARFVHEIDALALIGGYFHLYSGFQRAGVFTLYISMKGGAFAQVSGNPQVVENQMRNLRYDYYKKGVSISTFATAIFVSARWAANVIKEWQKSLTPQKRFEMMTEEMIYRAKSTGEAWEVFDSILHDAEIVLNRIKSSLKKYDVKIERGVNIFAVHITQAA